MAVPVCVAKVTVMVVANADGVEKISTHTCSDPSGSFTAYALCCSPTCAADWRMGSKCFSIAFTSSN